MTDQEFESVLSVCKLLNINVKNPTIEEVFIEQISKWQALFHHNQSKTEYNRAIYNRLAFEDQQTMQ